MAKKKLILNEGTTRKFMKYANIKPTYVSNFLNEAEEEQVEEGYGMGNREDEEKKEKLEEQEEEMEMDAEMEAEPEMDADMEVEDEMDMEDEGEEEEAEDMVMDLLGAIKDWAQSKGVSMELEGDEEEMEDMEDEGMEDMDAAPEGGDMGMADDEVDADLEAAGAEAVDDEEVIAEVTRRVARRLLRESAKRK